ncbi:MAG: hypothetical protein HEQ35_03900 [Gloeotrichia echinulata IR180]|nr:hypothetical protein [Gloeotrichia echinulata DEX184]
MRFTRIWNKSHTRTHHNPSPEYASGIFDRLCFDLCEKPESRFYQALRIVLINPGLAHSTLRALLTQLSRRVAQLGTNQFSKHCWCGGLLGDILQLADILKNINFKKDFYPCSENSQNIYILWQ